MARLAAEGDASGLLPAEDARALTRLLHRTLGRGFRLVVIEVDTPRLRRRIVEWLGEQVQSLDAGVVDLDVGSLAGENIWVELGERLAEQGEIERLVLALHGFQDPEGGIYQQLNVQRDLFVRDLGCFWVLLIHPYGSRRLQNIAPDFCDFCSLWIRAPSDALGLEGPRGEPRAVALSAGLSLADDARESLPDLLSTASAAIDAGRYAEARDLLTRFELAGGDGSVHQGAALCLRSALELSRGRLDMARDLAEQALAWAQARAEPAAEDIALSLHQLARVLAAQGDYGAARHHLERALEIRSGIQGTANHADMVPSLHELAQVLRDQGHLDEARRHLEHALELLTQRFGTQEHPDVVTTLLTLAQVVRAGGQLDAARSLVERVLEIESKLFGTDDHPIIAASLHELAAILWKQGDIAGARRQIERALEMDARVYGTDDHPSTAASLHELAVILRAQGDLDGALAAYERALEIHARVQGADHSAASMTEVALAGLLLDRGERAHAQSLLRHAHPILLRVFGPEHAWVQHAAALLESAT